MKQCSKCGERKDFSEFYKQEDKKDGLCYWCKKCFKEYKKKVYQKLFFAGYCSTYKYLERNRQGYKKWYYKGENKKKKFEYAKKRKKENPKLKLDNNVSNIIWRCLKGNKMNKSWKYLVNFTLQDLTHHLEKQFDDKMSWQNYGSYWHLDHIVPKSWFPYETAEEQAFKNCWGLANLQPLEAKENWSKNNKWISKIPIS